MRHPLVSAFLMLASVTSAAGAQANPKVYTPQFDNSSANGDDVPAVQVWLDERSLHFGDLIRPSVATDPGAYLTVIRVTTDGQLRVLYPQYPSQQIEYQPGRFANDRLPINTTNAFSLTESNGTGFVFAIASYYRFNYRYYSSGNQWSIGRLASASRFGSPFQIVRSFVDEITEGSDSYSMDYVMYDMDQGQYRSRYATRHRGYAYDDYYDLCLNAFDYYYNYCRGYSGYGYPYIVVGNPRPLNPSARKNMKIRPLVHDPVLPHVPREPGVVEGLQAQPDRDRDRIEAARRERMLRRNDGTRRGPSDVPRTERPMNEPRIYRPEMDSRRAQPRPEPMVAAPQRMPAPRIERRAEPPPRIERDPAPREKPRKDN
ncbi:MAG TPA: hypothetical protein VF042_03965 [Gemmatimonadaceae bacterium]